MFYSDTHWPQMRFGDVVRCFPSTHVLVAAPPPGTSIPTQYEIHLLSGLAIILTPDCEIGKSAYLTLAPLTSLKQYHFPLKNPFFRADPMLLNVRVPRENSIPPDDWSRKTDEERAAERAQGPTFPFTWMFVYPNKPPILNDESVTMDFGGGRETLPIAWHYADFRDAFRVQITKERHREFAGEKKLELTPDSRNILREKLSYFFGQIPKEDLVPLTATSPPAPPLT
jgi:hypothetical protein